jgi:hypothetical protein
VQPGASVDIEGSIDHGDYTLVDPITKIDVINGGNSVAEQEFYSDSGVKILNYRVTGDADSLVFEAL